METKTYINQEHRKQIRKQIYLPLGITIFLVLLLFIASIVGTVQKSSLINHWGNISAILLLSPILLLSLVNLVILIFAIKAINHLLKKFPAWFLTIQKVFQTLENRTQTICDSLVSPLIRIKSYSSIVKSDKHKQGA